MQTQCQWKWNKKYSNFRITTTSRERERSICGYCVWAAEPEATVHRRYVLRRFVSFRFNFVFSLWAVSACCCNIINIVRCIKSSLRLCQCRCIVLQVMADRRSKVWSVSHIHTHNLFYNIFCSFFYILSTEVGPSDDRIARIDAMKAIRSEFRPRASEIFIVVDMESAHVLLSQPLSSLCVYCAHNALATCHAKGAKHL